MTTLKDVIDAALSDMPLEHSAGTPVYMDFPVTGMGRYEEIRERIIKAVETWLSKNADATLTPMEQQIIAETDVISWCIDADCDGMLDERRRCSACHMTWPDEAPTC